MRLVLASEGGIRGRRGGDPGDARLRPPSRRAAPDRGASARGTRPRGTEARAARVRGDAARRAGADRLRRQRPRQHPGRDAGRAPRGRGSEPWRAAAAASRASPRRARRRVERLLNRSTVRLVATWPKLGLGLTAGAALVAPGAAAPTQPAAAQASHLLFASNPDGDGDAY